MCYSSELQPQLHVTNFNNNNNNNNFSVFNAMGKKSPGVFSRLQAARGLYFVEVTRGGCLDPQRPYFEPRSSENWWRKERGEFPSSGGDSKGIPSKMPLIQVVGIIWSNYRDLTRPHPKWWLSKGNPLISQKPRLVKYYNLARIIYAAYAHKNEW